MDETNNPRDVVLSYIQAMDSRNFEAVRTYLSDSVFIKGPAGEAFRSPEEFIGMMKQQSGKYAIKKIFVDGNDVCLLYDFITPKVSAFFCSWYQVKDGKITSIQTIFDPRQFAPLEK